MLLSSLKRIFGRSLLLVMLVAAVMLGSLMTTHSLSTATRVHAAAVTGSIQDPNIKYIGRWDTTSSTTMYTSYWSATYFKTRFTGKTVKIKLATSVNIYVSIDGGADVLYTAKGTFNLTPTPLASGTHSLRVAVRSGNIEFEGLVLDPGATTVAPTVSPKLIESVGDSITAGYTDTKAALSDYAWLVGELLHVEHTQIAQSGICLVAQSGCYGMNTQYFKEGGIHDLNSPDWNFSQYQASAVVINLGTNDNGHGVTKPTFEAAYIAFMRNIRAKYPKAAIFAFETLRQVYVPETQAAVQTLNAAGDKNVYFINTQGWISVSAGDYSADNGHPNDQGQAKIAAKLAPIIQNIIGA
jgi:lysophospholipase L1-like esterase